MHERAGQNRTPFSHRTRLNNRLGCCLFHGVNFERREKRRKENSKRWRHVCRTSPPPPQQTECNSRRLGNFVFGIPNERRSYFSKFSPLFDITYLHWMTKWWRGDFSSVETWTVWRVNQEVGRTGGKNTATCFGLLCACWSPLAPEGHVTNRSMQWWLVIGNLCSHTSQLHRW